METEIVELEGWTLRVRQVPGSGPFPVVLMLHGWLGNEDVMWVFADRIPEQALVIAPRALFPAAQGGHSWVRQRSDRLSELPAFDEAVDRLIGLAALAAGHFGADPARLHLMGFSQGAAICFAWAARNPGQMKSIAGLAGFVPAGFDSRTAQRPLSGLPVFIAHGTEDKIVPIEVMHAGAANLKSAGAELTICESRIGHKLSPSCLRALGDFYQRVIPA